MMGDTSGEERGDGVGGSFDEAVFQCEDELLEETMTIGSGDEETIERGLVATITAGDAIFLVRSATHGAFLVLAFGNGVEACGARECPLTFAAEATEGKQEINHPLSADDHVTTERGQYRV